MSYLSHSESQEMYLKVIYLLKKHNPNVRAVDIREELGYSKSSVSSALKLLKEHGYIEIDNNIISFTSKGSIVAKHVYNKYLLFAEMFENLGICEKEAGEIACKMEHIVPDSIFFKIRKALQKHRRNEHGDELKY